IVGGIGLEVRLEGAQVQPPVVAEGRDQRRDDSLEVHAHPRGQAAGVFLPRAVATRPSRRTSWGENASRKLLQTSRMAQRPASVRTGATTTLPLERPTSVHAAEPESSEITVGAGPWAASARGPLSAFTRSGPGGRSREVCTASPSPSAT